MPDEILLYVITNPEAYKALKFERALDHEGALDYQMGLFLLFFYFNIYPFDFGPTNISVRESGAGWGLKITPAPTSNDTSVPKTRRLGYMPVLDRHHLQVIWLKLLTVFSVLIHYTYHYKIKRMNYSETHFVFTCPL